MYTVLRSAFDLRKSLERKAGTKSVGDPQPLVARFWSEVDWWQNKSKTKQSKAKKNKTKQNRSKHNKTPCETIKTTCKKKQTRCKKKLAENKKKTFERKNKQNKTKPHHSIE